MLLGFNNPELQPIKIQPYNGMDMKQVNYLFVRLAKFYPKVELLPAVNPPDKAYIKSRDRYQADSLLRRLKDDNSIVVGVISFDICAPSHGYPQWGVIGLASFYGECVVSTHRLSKKNTSDQLLIAVLHELGHTMGLYHCPNIHCIMTAGNGKNNIDQTVGFCPKCKDYLTKKGFKL